MEIKIAKSTLRPFHETAIQDTVSTVYYGLLRVFSYVTWLSKAPDKGGGRAVGAGDCCGCCGRD